MTEPKTRAQACAAELEKMRECIRSRERETLDALAELDEANAELAEAKAKIAAWQPVMLRAVALAENGPGGPRPHKGNFISPLYEAVDALPPEHRPGKAEP